MPCRFASIFSHLTYLTDKDQRNINQASYLVSIRLILHSEGFFLSKSEQKVLI